MKDWQIRAIRTFIQAFLGILVPEISLILNGSLPDSIDGWVAVLIPVVCSSLAAGISAAWNIIDSRLKELESFKVNNSSENDNNDHP